MRLEGIYAASNAILLKIKTEDNSNISYDVGSIRFVIKDGHQAKRTDVQEKPLQPLYVFHVPASIPADSAVTAVFALPKFSLSNQQYLDVELAEKNGGRNLQLRLKNRKLLKAKRL